MKGGNILIGKRILSKKYEEDLSFLKTTYNLYSSSDQGNIDGCITEIKNITLVPRSGTHNNFKTDKEIILYVISGELLYSDSIGTVQKLIAGNLMYISSLQGITYDIYNKGIDFLDMIEITLISEEEGFKNSDNATFHKQSRVNFSSTDDFQENQWNYRVSSLNGLAPIKSPCDINIYSISLTSNNEATFTIGNNRQAYLFQGYGQSIFTTDSSDKVVLTGSDTLHITNENFQVKAKIPSNLLLLETLKL